MDIKDIKKLNTTRLEVRKKHNIDQPIYGDLPYCIICHENIGMNILNIFRNVKNEITLAEKQKNWEIKNKICLKCVEDLNINTNNYEQS